MKLNKIYNPNRIMRKNLFFAFVSVLTVLSLDLAAQRKDYLISLETNLGSAKIILYDETPLHKANFIKLSKSKFYDGLIFHRVIKNFMIQGGDPLSKDAEKGARVGFGGDNMERIPYEFNKARVHKKGALAAARDGNAEKKSSACQFYIVQGKKLSDDEILKVQGSNNLTYSGQQKMDYVTLGGTPFLDNNYTVFGEVIQGLDLVDKIAQVSTDQYNRPNEDVKMSITVKKISKRKISRKYGYKYTKA
jgi:cyclophilin family peptidyl-prolyl cis-trans isomerase